MLRVCSPPCAARPYRNASAAQLAEAGIFGARLCWLSIGYQAFYEAAGRRFVVIAPFVVPPALMSQV